MINKYKDKQKEIFFPYETFQVLNSLGEGAEGVAEGFRSQVEKSLQEHVDLQWVEALPLVCKRVEFFFFFF